MALPSMEPSSSARPAVPVQVADAWNHLPHLAHAVSRRSQSVGFRSCDPSGGAAGRRHGLPWQHPVPEMLLTISVEARRPGCLPPCSSMTGRSARFLSHSLTHIFFAIPRNCAGRPRSLPDWSVSAGRSLGSRSEATIRRSARESSTTRWDRGGHPRRMPNLIGGTNDVAVAASEEKAAHRHRNRSQCRLPLQFRRTTGTVDQYRNWHSHYPLCAGKSGLDQPSLPPFGRCYSERAGESAGRQRRRAVRVRVLCSRKPPARSRTVSSSWPIVGRTGTAVDPRTVTGQRGPSSSGRRAGSRPRPRRWSAPCSCCRRGRRYK